MEIDLNVQHVTRIFGAFKAVDDVTFSVPAGHFFSILGPSGCGKTTLLRMIAGFQEPSEGKIEIRGKDMAGMAPNRRPVNLVFQHLALFPMMDVGENIAFGLRQRGEKRPVIREKVAAILKRVDLSGFERKQIHQLSGGQKQRVAIARCLVLDPTVLLLDEPLGALDLKLREQMKVELKHLQNQVGTTFIYITHDQSEALVMSDAVAVMNRGRFEQVDTPQNLYHYPKTAFVARFVGESTPWEGMVIRKDDAGGEIRTPGGLTFSVRMEGAFSVGDPATLFVRPESVSIAPPETLGRLNRLKVKVRSILFDGANSRLLVIPMGEETEMRVALPQTRQFDDIRPGDIIEVGWDPKSGICFPEKGLQP